MFAAPVVMAIVTPTVFTVAAAALSVAGVITGNKTLSKIGGLIGLAGGIASLANAATSAASAAGAVAEGASAASPAVEAAGSFGHEASHAQALMSGGDVAGAAVSGATSGVGQVGTVSGVGGASIPGVESITSPAEAAVAGSSGSIINDATGLSGSANALGGTSGQVNPAGTFGSLGADPNAALTANSIGSGADKVFGALGDIGKVGATTSGATNGGFGDGIIGRLLNSDFLKGDATRAGLIKVGGEMIAKGFGRDVQGEYVDLQKTKLQQDRDELARKTANQNNIGQVKLNQAPNPNVNLYPNGHYRPVGIINRARTV